MPIPKYNHRPSFHSDNSSSVVKNSAYAIAYFHEAFLAIVGIGALGLLFFGAFYR